jgi:hypothetical protein
MKPIDQMNLTELADHYDHHFGVTDMTARLRTIHDLTRWITVSERMPTNRDGDEDGYVLISERQNETPHKRYTRYVKIDNLDDPDYFYTITHWQHITPPEGV